MFLKCVEITIQKNGNTLSEKKRYKNILIIDVLEISSDDSSEEDSNDVDN